MRKEHTFVTVQQWATYVVVLFPVTYICYKGILCRWVFIYSWQRRAAQQYTQNALLCFRSQQPLSSAPQYTITFYVYCLSCLIFCCICSLRPYNFALRNLLFLLLYTSSLSNDSCALFSIYSSQFSIYSSSFFSIWFLLSSSVSYISLFSFLI
jgi:hypothetical protein